MCGQCKQKKKAIKILRFKDIKTFELFYIHLYTSIFSSGLLLFGNNSFFSYGKFNLRTFLLNHNTASSQVIYYRRVGARGPEGPWKLTENELIY